MSNDQSLLGGGASAGLHVVDKKSLQFVEVGRMAEDSFDVGWEVTPEPAERVHKRTLPVRNLAPPVQQKRAPPRPLPSTPPPAPRAPKAQRPGVLHPPAPQPQAEADPEKGPSLEEMPNVFVGVSPRQLEDAMDYFDVFDIHAGGMLIQQGEKQPALVMILRGQVEVTRYERRRRAQSGSVLGLTTLFGDGRWPVGLRTLTDARIMILDIERYRHLRNAGSVVSEALEEYALEQMLQELERTAKDVATYNDVKPIDQLMPKKSFLERLAAVIGGGGISVVDVNAIRALRASPLFRNSDDHHLTTIANRMDGIKVQTGEFLMTEGQPSTHVYVVVSGSVAVIAAAGGGMAIKHQTLTAGDAFGAWSVLRTGGNWASYIVMETTVLLEMDKLGWTEISTCGDEASSVLRLALTRSLASRVSNSMAQLAAHESGMKPTVDTVAEQEASQFVTINPASRR